MEGAPQVGQLTCAGEDTDTNTCKIKPGVSKVWRPELRTCRLIKEIGQQAAHDSLVADNQDVLLPFQLHDDWLQTVDQVLVRLHRRETVIRILKRFGLQLRRYTSRMTKGSFYSNMV